MDSPVSRTNNDFKSLLLDELQSERSARFKAEREAIAIAERLKQYERQNGQLSPSPVVMTDGSATSTPRNINTNNSLYYDNNNTNYMAQEMSPITSINGSTYNMSIFEINDLEEKLDAMHTVNKKALEVIYQNEQRLDLASKKMSKEEILRKKLEAELDVVSRGGTFNSPSKTEIAYRMKVDEKLRNKAEIELHKKSHALNRLRHEADDMLKQAEVTSTVDFNDDETNANTAAINDTISTSMSDSIVENVKAMDLSALKLLEEDLHRRLQAVEKAEADLIAGQGNVEPQLRTEQHNAVANQDSSESSREGSQDGSRGIDPSLNNQDGEEASMSLTNSSKSEYVFSAASTDGVNTSTSDNSNYKSLSLATVSKMKGMVSRKKAREVAPLLVESTPTLSEAASDCSLLSPSIAGSERGARKSKGDKRAHKGSRSASTLGKSESGQGLKKSSVSDSIASLTSLPSNRVFPDDDKPFIINKPVSYSINTLQIAMNQDYPVIITACADSNLHVIDIGMNRTVAKLSKHTDRVLCLSVCRDIIVSGSRDESVCIWDIISMKCLHRVRAHKGPVWTVGSIYDTETNIIYAVSGGSDGKVRVWNTVDGTKVSSINAHQSDVLALDTHSIGSNFLIITGGSDALIKVWDMKKTKSLKVLEGSQSAVTYVKVLVVPRKSTVYRGTTGTDTTGDGDGASPFDSYTNEGDKLLLISSSKSFSIRVWDIYTGTAIFNLVGHSQPINGLTVISSIKALALSETYYNNTYNNVLLSCSNDGTCRLWNLEIGKEIVKHSWHGVNCTSIASNMITVNQIKDYNLIATFGSDKTLRINDVDHLLTTASKAPVTERKASAAGCLLS